MPNKLLHNIWCRRLFTYRIDMKQTARYLLITPDILKAKLLGSEVSLVRACQKYCQQHPNMLRPNRYLTIRRRILANDPKREEILREIDYDLCANLEITLAIYGGTIGSIYIPNRGLEFSKSSFKYMLIVDSEEVGL